MSKEIVLDDYAFLVSQTNEKGIITFASNDFCAIAGYSVEELIGKPHNIVRHPDMPKEAFKSLWETVKSGKIWTGYVKNATKNGDFYWVFATVYPTIIDGVEKGFISCRRKASKKEIEITSNLYKTMK